MERSGRILGVLSVLLLCILGCGAIAVTESNNGFRALQQRRQISDPRVVWTQFGPGMSGYNESSWYHPTDPNYVYITPDMGNSYYSTDGARSWHSVRDHDGSNTVAERFTRVFAMDFSRQEEGFGLAVNRLGLWVTRDKGKTWVPDHRNGTNFWFPGHWGDHLSAVAFDPTDDNIIFVGSGNFWDVKSNERTYANPYGTAALNTGRIWRSQDRGLTWSLVNQGIDRRAEFGKIFVDPTQPSHIYAATSAGFYRSTDSGDKWVLSNQGLDNGMIRDLDMYYNPETGDVILYVIDQVFWTPDDHNRLQSSGGIFVSYDRGQSWENITANLGLDLRRLSGVISNSLFGNRGLAWWFETGAANTRHYTVPGEILQSFNRLAVDPNNPDRIYVAHNATHTSSFLPDAVWTTQDRGENWYVSTRLGSGWQSDADYWNSRYVPCDVDITEANMKFGHIYQSRLVERAWAQVYPSWGIRSLAVAPNGNVLIGMNQQLLLSTNEGRSWEQIDSIETAPGSQNWVGSGNSNLPGRFIHQDPRLQGTVYFSTGEHGLWKTTDDGEQVYSGAQAVTQLSEQAPSPASIAFDPTDVSTMYGLFYRQTHAGEFRRSTDGGYTWHTISTVIPGIGVTDRVHQQSLLIDPENPNQLYFCVSSELLNHYHPTASFAKTGVYKTDDGGYSWKVMNEGLPSHADVHRLTMDPANSNRLFAAVLQKGGVDGGLYRTDTGATRWERMPIPASITQVTNVHFDVQGRLYITTGAEGGTVAGGGAWVSEDQGYSWQQIFSMPYVLSLDTAVYDPQRILLAVGVVNANSSSAIDYVNPGVYFSQDGGHSWIKINTGIGMPHKLIDVQFDRKNPDVFWATTLGCGFYKGHLTDDLEQVFRERLLPEPFELIGPLSAADSADPTNVEFSWEQASHPLSSHRSTSYRFLLALDRDFTQVVMDTVVAGTSLSLDCLDYGETYYWKVGALSLAPWSSSAKDVYASYRTKQWNTGGPARLRTHSAPAVPSAPARLQGVGFLGERIYLTWEAVAEANRYVLYRQERDSEEYLPLAVLADRGTTSYLDEDVQPEMAYSYLVYGENDRGKGLAETVSVVLSDQQSLLEETFIDGNLSHPGRTIGRWMYQEDPPLANVRALFPQAMGTMVLENAVADSYRLQVRFRINNWGDPRYATFRMRASIHERNEYQVMYAHAREEFVFSQRVDGVRVDLGLWNISLEQNIWYDLQLEVIEDSLVALYVDGQKLGSFVQDNTIGKGNIEFFFNNVDADLDYVSVTN